MKRQRKIEKDNRGVAIYARKSRITNKGNSIGVQFKQCVDYAKKELGLDEEYEFLQYEDSNGINTASGLYKIFIQIFAVIAEFERDTLIERIVDNMMELAKDGR